MNDHALPPAAATLPTTATVPRRPTSRPGSGATDTGDREQLVRQLRGIGDVSAAAAERHVAAYERGFLAIFGSPPGARAAPHKARR